MNVRRRAKELRPNDESDEERLLNEYEGDEQPQPNNINESDAEDVDTSTVSPASSRWRRLAFLLLGGLVILFAFLIRCKANRKPQTLYASRYSKEYKFRPAASPIITETLKDGRIRLRGATPPPKTDQVKPTPPTKGKRKKKAGPRKPKRKVH